ncbi:MAG TPA: autotransporter-associated beta strand repeat-containing protein, partial [Tepidisphaeraceae bacterium]
MSHGKISKRQLLRRRSQLRRLAPVVSAIGAGLSLAPLAQATNYTWLPLTAGNASGSWATVTNWSPNLATATTAADTVLFTSDITVDSIISLNSPQLIGRNFPNFPDNAMIFGDANTATAAGWTINATSGTPNDNTNILTLSAAGNVFEIVKVNDLGAGKAVTINAQISNNAAGDLALAKAGNGTLILTANNANETGAIAVNNGVLMLDFSQTWSPTANIIGDSSTGSANGSHLQMQGGTLILKGKAGASNSQTFSAGSGLELGSSTLSFQQNGATSVSLNLGALTRNANSGLDVILPSSGVVSVSPGTAGGSYPSLPFGTNVDGSGLIIDDNATAFVTVNGGSDWGAVSGGNIVAASSIGGFYTASTPTSLAGNANVVTNTTLAGGTTIGSLRFNDAAGHSIDLGGNTLGTGGILMTPASGSNTISNGVLTTGTNFGGDLVIDQESNSTLTISAAITSPGLATALTKNGPGALVLSGNNTYTGNTFINGGVVSIVGGTTGTNNVGGTEHNVEVAPAYGNTATLIVSAGTVNANRVLMGGNSGNFAGGKGTLVQTGGTINSGQWFSVGTQGNGTYNMSGGTMNQNGNGGSQMEVGVFGIGQGTVNMSGTAQINILNNGNIRMGVFDTAGGLWNHNGGAITFYSDNGAVVGGTGALFVGSDAGASTFNLNGGTVTVPSVGHGGSGTGFFNFNGGVLKAARAGANLMSGLTAVRVQAGGANIDTNSNDVSLTQGLSHDPALGGTPDGGLIKNGAGAMTISGVSTYTGPTLVNSGTLRLQNTSGVPQAVGNYTYNMATGPLTQGTVVPNAGTGGAVMNGSINHNDSVDPGNGAVIVPGKFGNGIAFDGAGSSVDINSQVVDQSSGGVWTMSTWINTTTPGSAFVSKNTGGTTWAANLSTFYLASNPISAVPGTLPTAVRFGGGFLQAN